MKIDFHVHCNSDDPVLLKQLAASCEANETMAALAGGLRYGAADYCPNTKVLEICRQYPQTFLPMARFDLWEQVDPNDVRRFAEQGYKGLKFIYPWYEYDHDSYMPVYEAAAETGLPVLFHTGNFRPSEADARWKRPVLRNMAPVTLDRIARSFPGLKIVMAHLGTSMWRHEAAELVKLHPNLYFDLAGCGSWLGLSAEELQMRLRPELPLIDGTFSMFRKMVLGSDAYVTHPHLIGEAQTAYSLLIRKLGLPDDVARGIRGETVAGWLLR